MSDVFPLLYAVLVRRFVCPSSSRSKQCAPTCAMGVQHDAAETMNELFDVDLEGSIGYFKVPAAHQNGSRAF